MMTHQGQVRNNLMLSMNNFKRICKFKYDEQLTIGINSGHSKGRKSISAHSSNELLEVCIRKLIITVKFR